MHQILGQAFGGDKGSVSFDLQYTLLSEKSASPYQRADLSRIVWRNVLLTSWMYFPGFSATLRLRLPSL